MERSAGGAPSLRRAPPRCCCESSLLRRGREHGARWWVCRRSASQPLLSWGSISSTCSMSRHRVPNGRPWQQPCSMRSMSWCSRCRGRWRPTTPAACLLERGSVVRSWSSLGRSRRGSTGSTSTSLARHCGGKVCKRAMVACAAATRRSRLAAVELLPASASQRSCWGMHEGAPDCRAHARRPL